MVEITLLPPVRATIWTPMDSDVMSLLNQPPMPPMWAHCYDVEEAELLLADLANELQ